MKATPHIHATTSAPPRNERPGPAAGRRVTDAPTRVFHALFALSFAGAYLTAESERWRALHVTLGYTLAAMLAFRLVYAFFGPRPLALSVLARRTSALLAWLRSAARGGAADPLALARQGLPALGGGIIVALLALAAPVALSGYVTYAEWGGEALTEALAEVHEWLGNAMLAAVVGHLGVLLATSLWRRSNLALSMLTGRMPGKGPDLVPRQRTALGIALAAAAIAFGAWQWQQYPHGLLPEGPLLPQSWEDDDD